MVAVSVERRQFPSLATMWVLRLPPRILIRCHMNVCMWVFEIQTKRRDRGVPALIVIVIIIIYAHALNALQVN